MKKSKKKKSYNFGLMAEKIAIFFLMLKGYRILAHNYQNPKGEIDILAVKGKVLTIVEVKARQNFEQCGQSITPWKQQKIFAAAQWLISGRAKIAGLRNISECNIRFDVIFIVPWRLPKHLKDAWRM